VYITVREILEIGVLQRATVICGEGGLDNIVKSVTVMDVPDISKWLKGNEFLLTNAFVIKDDIAAQKKLILDLKTKNVSALGIKLKRFLDEVPEEMIKLSDEYNIPIISLPSEISWIDVIEPVMQEIINKQLKILEETIQINNELIETASNSTDLDSLCRYVEKLIGRPTALIDLNFNLIEKSDNPIWESINFDNFDGKSINPYIFSKNITVSKRLYTLSNTQIQMLNMEAILAPIEKNNVIYGYIIVLIKNNEDNLQNHDILCLGQASVVALLEITIKSSMENISQIFYNSFLNSLIEGIFVNKEEILLRAKFIGKTLFEKYSVVLVNLSEFKNYTLKLENVEINEVVMDNLNRNLINTLYRSIPEISNALIYFKNDFLVLFLPNIKDIFSNFEKIITNVQKSLSIYVKKQDIKIGVGSWHNLLDIHISYNEAHKAINLTNSLTEKKIIYFDELGIMKMFIDKNENIDIEMLKKYHDRYILPILSQDEKSDSKLFETLDMFIKCNLSMPKTSEVLFIHKNTLRFRLNKIENLLNISFNCNDDIFNITLSLKIHLFLEEFL